MTRTDEERKLLRLFAEAFDSEKAADSPHVVDDEDLLARWSMGVLDPDEHEAMIAHLADCPECRDVVGLMVKNGALVLPEVPEPVVEPPPPPTPTHFPWFVLALAAAVLVAVGLPLLWPSGDTRLGTSLALKDFGFELDGGSYGMDLKTLPKELRDEWDSKTTARPKDVKLWLQYGRFLLEHNEADEAIEKFEVALGLQPANTDALVGKGVALYEQAYNEDSKAVYESARDLFLEAIKLSPDDFSAHVNAAIVLDRLDEREQAAEHWNLAYELAPDDRTRQDIDKHRRDRQENPAP